MKSFFKFLYYFLSSKVFLKNIGMMIGIALLSFVLLFWVILPSYTRHNESIEVPDIKGLSVKNAERQLKSRKLRLVVTDTIYDAKRNPGIILKQSPEANSRVKPNRSIYLTVNSNSAPPVNIYYNEIIGRPLNFVEKKFRALGLKIGQLKYVDGGGENTVAAAYTKDKILIFKEADPSKGERRPKQPYQLKQGDKIDLELYKGKDSGKKTIPDLSCMIFSEAEFSIKANAFYIGTVSYGPNIIDTMNAYVVRQSPSAASKASMGAGIDIWLSAEKPEVCNEMNQEDAPNSGDTFDDDFGGIGG
ncbi:PASTA domain-containing protein [Saprospira sp. CCB-QB6]|uniref:PASTA domain-containing protein n=1 Tax=Saprospira sp. CCB-QB6 TaxID=3023936 RepID=UPI00234AE142|nr:PASTA domain-containing protein [Saprospira sp. CCB-QB6]WCL82256.1 PASTA domain-containing protein [Saprospira sp. CCB-QB6]